MSEYILSIAGTPEGATLATILAIMAAFLHALFGALQKGSHDPWISRAAIDASYGLIALPVILFVVPWPEPHMWPVFVGMFVIHTLYKIAQARTYDRGAYTVVYPVVRGTGPLFAMFIAVTAFNEHYTLLQWFGVLTLVTGIFLLGFYNYRHLTVGRETLVPALIWAVITGAFVAGYTTYDAWGIRLSADPMTFLFWFFFIDGFFMPILMRRELLALPHADRISLAKRGIIGGIVAYASFGGIMLATRLDQVGQAAVLRETSTVFAALIGWLVLKEKTGPRRVAMMAMIAAGAVIVEFGG